MKNIRDMAIKWYQDKKIVIALVIIIASFVIGKYGAVLAIAKYYEPTSLITGLSIYSFRWLLLFLGVFMVGWRTVKAMQSQIHHKVRKTVKNTYHHARKFPMRATDYTKKMHKRGISKITATSKIIADKIKQ